MTASTRRAYHLPMFQLAANSSLSNTAFTLRLIECGVLFFLIPLLLTFYKNIVPPIPVLIAFTLVMGVWLWLDPTFDRSAVWNTRDFAKHLTAIVSLFLLVAVVLGAALYLYQPDALFAFPRERPFIWLIVMCFYPLVSVVPQTIIYRAFFFHRYESLFPSAIAMILFAGVAFGFGHIIFKNWIAITLTLAGGLIFAWRYYTTRSLLISTIEHAMYGQLIFTLGYGMFLFHGRASVTPGG